MPHIKLDPTLPGIIGPLKLRPETTKPLSEFTEILMRGENSLTVGERELIATYVSSLNDCFFCENAHGALAQHFLQCDTSLIDDVKKSFESTSISDKMKSLLTIAGSVQKGGKNVTTDQIEKAKALGATDMEIHDTVLISAAFCMFNRYVDGLDTWTPRDKEFYSNRVSQRAKEGYTMPDPNH
jgi:uncharacterized peroxidase-related enzyme